MMNQRYPKDSAETTVRDIRRATRRRYSAEDKIRFVLEAFEAKTVLPNSVVGKVSIPMFTTGGPRSGSRQVTSGR